MDNTQTHLHMSVAYKAIGARLSAAMGLRGPTTADVARLTEISRQTIWRYQRGRTCQSFHLMAVLAHALDVSLDYLAYGTGQIDRTP